MNRTVKECLTKLLAEHADDWDNLLPQVTMAINSSVNESTGYTPFFLAHGEEMQLPIDLAVPTPMATHNTPHDYVDQLYARFQLAYDFARSSMRAQVERAKRRYDAQARTITFRTGDQVYYLKAVPHANEASKTFLPWDGPCTVVTVLSDVTVRIQHNANRWEKVVHIDRLYHQPTDPDVVISELLDTPDNDDPEPTSSSPPPSASSSSTNEALHIIPVPILHPDANPLPFRPPLPSSTSIPVLDARTHI
jgi:hypothetical protein